LPDDIKRKGQIKADAEGGFACATTPEGMKNLLQTKLPGIDEHPGCARNKAPEVHP
jgi:hypothetical protein